MINKDIHIYWQVAKSMDECESKVHPVKGCEFPPSRKKLSTGFLDKLEKEIHDRGLSDLLAFEVHRIFMDVYSYYAGQELNQEVFMNYTEYYLDKYYKEYQLFDQLHALTSQIFPLLFEESR